MIRHTGDPPFPSVAAAQRFLAGYDHYARHGYGRWAVVDRASGAFLGWCGLRYTAATAETDVGFRFFRRYWGQGLATEAAAACVSYGFRQLQLREVIGRARRENTASVRVLEKIGMTYDRPFYFDGHAGVIYRVAQPPA